MFPFLFVGGYGGETVPFLHEALQPELGPFPPFPFPFDTKWDDPSLGIDAGSAFLQTKCSFPFPFRCVRVHSELFPFPLRAPAPLLTSLGYVMSTSTF